MEAAVLALGILAWCLPAVRPWDIIAAVASIVLGFVHNRRYGMQKVSNAGMILAALYLGFLLVLLIVSGSYFSSLGINLFKVYR